MLSEHENPDKEDSDNTFTDKPIWRFDVVCPECKKDEDLDGMVAQDKFGVYYVVCGWRQGIK